MILTVGLVAVEVLEECLAGLERRWGGEGSLRSEAKKVKNGDEMVLVKFVESQIINLGYRTKQLVKIDHLRWSAPCQMICAFLGSSVISRFGCLVFTTRGNHWSYIWRFIQEMRIFSDRGA